MAHFKKIDVHTNQAVFRTKNIVLSDLCANKKTGQIVNWSMQSSLFVVLHFRFYDISYNDTTINS